MAVTHPTSTTRSTGLTGPRATTIDRWARGSVVALRAFSVGLVAFFGTGLVGVLAGVDPGETIGPLVRWGHGGEAYELMIATVYLVLAGYLWVAAGDLRRHRLLVDFTVVSSIAHFGLMFVLGLVQAGEHRHLRGDVLLGWLGLLPVAVVWARGRTRL